MSRLRRSLHFVPGGNERMLEKAPTLAADALILDLEDAVPPDQKDAARRRVVDWLGAHASLGRERIVRINAGDTPWHEEDVEAIVAARPETLLVPKVESQEAVKALSQTIEGLELSNGIDSGTIGLILLAAETPRSVVDLDSLVGDGRVNGLTWGAEDLAVELGALENRDAGGFTEPFQYTRSRTLFAARANGIDPLDTVFADLSDPGGLARETTAAAKMGFVGKMTIHPSQIATINDAFTPSDELVQECTELLEAFEESQREGRMAFTFRGRMVDAPHLTQAHATLARAKAIDERPERD